MRRAVLVILGSGVLFAAFSVFRVGTRVYGQEESSSETRSVWDGVYTQEQAKRGEEIYDKTCSACHGENLNGTGESPALAGGKFLSNWGGLTVGGLFERIG